MNKRQKFISFFIAAIIALLTGGCTTSTSTSEASIPSSSTPALSTITPTQNTPTPNPTLVAGFVGLWQGSNGSFYQFMADGTWHWDQARDQVEGSPENTGKWWVAGEILYIVDLTGPGKCPESQVGSYKAQTDGSSLDLVLMTDDCTERVKQTRGHYRLLP